MKLKIKAGTTSRIIRIKVVNSTTGAPMTGLVYNSSGLVAYYIRNGQSSETPITLVTATIGTFTSGGFKEINATTMPGYYELGVPNAAIAISATDVAIRLGGVSSMKDVDIEIELDAVDYQSSTNFGLGNLDLKTSSIPSMSARYNHLMLETDVSYVASSINFSLRSGITASQQFNDCVAVFLWSGDISFGARQNVGQIKSTFSSNNSINTYSAPQGALANVSSGDIVRIYRQFPANVNQWNGNNVAVPSISGYPDVNAFGLEGYKVMYSGYVASTSNTFTYNLDNLASSITNSYAGAMLVPISGGTPIGPGKVIISYNGPTRTAVIRPAFPSVLTSGTAIYIVPLGNVGLAGINNSDINTVTLQGITSNTPMFGVNVASIISGNPANLSDVYFADIKQYRDKTNGRDEYSAVWFKNGVMTSSGDVTNSRISVYSGTNGGQVFINQNLPYSAVNIPTMYRNEGTNIISSGLPYFVTVSGTIDAATRIWSKIIGRHDSVT